MRGIVRERPPLVAPHSAHLDGVQRYIAKDRPEAADRVVDRNIEATERLEAFPFSARRGP